MDNTTINADEIWKVAWTYIRTVVDTAREPFVILDKDLRVLSANKTFYDFFRVEKSQTEGTLVYKLGNNQWNIPKLKILLEDILPKNTHFEDFKVEHEFQGIGFKVIMLNARQVHTTTDNQKPIILLAMEDITKQIELEAKMREFSKQLNEEVSKRTSSLEMRVKELERVNETLAIKEAKIMELTQEVEKLKQQIKKG